MELKIEYLPVTELKPYENNARKHAEADIEAIKKSIEEFGFNDPIGIWHDIIVEGHGRLLAAQELEMTEVPVIRLDHMTDEERRAYAIAHNKTAELSEWDFEMLDTELEDIFGIDMSQFGFDVGEEEPKEIIEDEPPKPPEEPTTIIGDIILLGEHKLICGDSTDPAVTNKLLANQKADMVFTDPPYGVSYIGTNNPNGREWEMIKNDELRGDSLYQFLIAAFENIKNCLKMGGSFYVWYANNNSVEFCQAVKDAGLKQKQIIIWHKGMVLGHSDYHWTYEPCIYGCHEEQNSTWYGDRTQKTLWDMNRTEIKELKKKEAIDMLLQLYADKDVWELNRDPANQYMHPTQKPVALSAKAIQNSSRTTDIVLDLFGGSGSTLIACEQLDRKCYMAELDPKYCDVIIQRYINFKGSAEDVFFIRDGEKIPYEDVK